MSAKKGKLRSTLSHPITYFVLALSLPLIEWMIRGDVRFCNRLCPMFIFAFLGLGLHVITGLTGLLHLGLAALMALGAYSYAIFTADIYPFQFGFLGGLCASAIVGVIFGAVTTLPAVRLRGDYLAIVTMGFGEIVQDLLKNLETITKGTQGISPLPGPVVFGVALSEDARWAWYYVLLLALFLAVVFVRNLERSRVGLRWLCMREDELAATCSGMPAATTKLHACAVGSAFASIAGALFVSHLGTSGEPGTYDFQISVLALCIVIVGGIGNLYGVLIGAFVMVGCNSILLVELSSLLPSDSADNVFFQPNNWKYLIFGLCLVLMMRWAPHGLLPRKVPS